MSRGREKGRERRRGQLGWSVACCWPSGAAVEVGACCLCLQCHSDWCHGRQGRLRTCERAWCLPLSLLLLLLLSAERAPRGGAVRWWESTWRRLMPLMRPHLETPTAAGQASGLHAAQLRCCSRPSCWQSRNCRCCCCCWPRRCQLRPQPLMALRRPSPQLRLQDAQCSLGRGR